MKSIMKSICIILLLSSVACTKTPVANDTLVVGTNAYYPPYESSNEKGEIVGFDIDVIQAVAKKMGKKLVLQNMAFDSLILALKQKKCDLIISGISITASRQKEIALVPYQGEAVTGLTLLFKQKPPVDIKTPNDLVKLGNKTVAVQVGTFQETYLNKVAGIVPKALDSNVEMLMDLAHEKSVAVLVEPNIAADILKKNPQLFRLDFQLPQDEWVLGYGIGVPKDHEAIIREVKKAVDELKADGSLQKFAKKWF